MDVTVINAAFGAAAGFAYAGFSYLANKKADSRVGFNWMFFLKTFGGASLIGMLLGIRATTATIDDIALMIGAPIGYVEGITKLVRLFKK